MRGSVRVSLLALVVGALLALIVPVAAQATGFGLTSHGWFAANCKEGFATCGKKPVEENKEGTLAEAKEEGYTQAAGHPNFGVTDFKLNSVEIQKIPFPAFAPVENLKNLRVDVSPGFSTNPQAVVKCSVANFTGTEIEVAGEKVFTPPSCPESEIGENIVTTVVPVGGGVFADVELSGKVYNLEQTKGLSSLFGVALNLKPLLGVEVFSHTLIEGNVEWGKQANGTGKADYHDYFEIKNIAQGLLRSRLIYKGNIGNTGSGVFLTNPTSCTGIGPQTTTRWRGESEKGVVATAEYTTLLGTENCGAVPFNPGFSLTPETSQSDATDGLETLLTLPHDNNPAHLDDSQVKKVEVKLPEGMTMNPSAASGLEGCTPAQAQIHSEEKGMKCPEHSKIGTDELTVPGLPSGAFSTGTVYLGKPESGQITGPPYTIYVDAESEQYGVSVRLKGEVTPNESTGQLTTTFSENPEQPFSSLKLKFNGGALAPIANGLACSTTKGETIFTPFSGTSNVPLGNEFTPSGCKSPLPFSPSQSTTSEPATGGSHSNFTFNLERGEGQQMLAKVVTALPGGLLGLVPTVGQCTEAQALANSCPENSQIGTLQATSGSGSPYTFPGKVYFMGPTRGAPYGMAFITQAEAGPFNLGPVVAIATLNVDIHTARVILSAELPQIVKGIPIRLRKLSVSVTRQGFLINPTNCNLLATNSLITGLQGVTGTNFGTPVALSSPFQMTGCTALPFKPSFRSATSAKVSKNFGASLETTLNMPNGGANVKTVVVTLPKQLPSRLTTLQKACPAATFEANYHTCPPGSFVGGVRANTPVLPAKMKGPAILVSHAGAAFPDLDLILEGNGVGIVLVGNTNIKNSITTSTFAATPDVPVSSITVNLPVGQHSALGGFGNFCTNPLIMPTTIVGQNGVVFKQNTKMRVNGCGVTIVGHRVIGRTAYITVKTSVAGRVSGGGPGLGTVFRTLGSATNAATLRVPLRRGRPFTTRLRVGFVPRNRGLSTSTAFVTVRFR